MRLLLAGSSFALVSISYAQQSLYGQCGGTGWSGATTCVSGSTCVVLNSYYSQCQPGSASSPASTTPSSKTSTKASTTKTLSPPSSPPPSSSLSPTKTTGSGAPSTTVSGGSGPGATLRPGWFWVRSVETPYFHYYLQTKSQDVPGTAILGDYTTAGQFNIINGQLEELIDPVKGTMLYANVGEPANATSTDLPVTFATTPGTHGTWAFSGDAVTWSTPEITRQNLAAFYVCGGNQLFINLGAYLYMTPAGCSDETIHSYGGSTAVS